MNLYLTGLVDIPQNMRETYPLQSYAVEIIVSAHPEISRYGGKGLDPFNMEVVHSSSRYLSPRQ